MKRNQIAAQLYTVRKQTQNQLDFAQTIHRIKGIGYHAVELSGVGPLPPAVIRRVLLDEGVQCVASHESEELLFGDTQRVAERLWTLGCDIAVYAWPGEQRNFADLATVTALIENLNRAGEQLARAGIRLAYHHHHMELTRLGSRLALDMLFRETDARYVGAVLDTYWLQYGGVNPSAWCRRIKGRLMVLHLKDYAVTPDRRVTFAEVGRGNLDWPEIIAAADEAGCAWFAVEQDECTGDPFVSLQRSHEYLTAQIACGGCETEAP